MPNKLAIASVFYAVAFSAALAQTTTLPPAPVGPTDVQCSQPFKEGMGWTLEQFTKACAEMKDRKKP